MDNIIIKKSDVEEFYIDSNTYHNTKGEDLSNVLSDNRYSVEVLYHFFNYKLDFLGFEIYDVSLDGLNYFSIFYHINGLKIHFDTISNGIYKEGRQNFKSTDSFVDWINDKVNEIKSKLIQEKQY